MDKKYRPPNLQLQEKSKSFESKPKMIRGGVMLRGQKGNASKDFKELKAVSHSVSILFNGKSTKVIKYYTQFCENWHMWVEMSQQIICL